MNISRPILFCLHHFAAKIQKKRNRKKFQGNNINGCAMGNKNHPQPDGWG